VVRQETKPGLEKTGFTTASTPGKPVRRSPIIVPIQYGDARTAGRLQGPVPPESWIAHGRSRQRPPAFRVKGPDDRHGIAVSVVPEQKAHARDREQKSMEAGERTCAIERASPYRMVKKENIHRD